MRVRIISVPLLCNKKYYDYGKGHLQGTEKN